MTSPQPTGALVSGAKLAQLRNAVWAQEAAMDHKISVAIDRRVDEQRFRSHMNIVLTLSVACACVYAYIKIYSLKGMYPKAYAWWEVSQDEHIRGAGHHSLVTVPAMALRVEFPSFYTLQTLFMSAETIPLAGAEFLLIMASTYPTRLRPILWNGSAEQLRYADIGQFLPLDAQRTGGVDWTYVWSSWRATNATKNYVNPWYDLFPSATAMTNSPAFQAYYGTPPERGFLQALFQGGLVEVALQFGNVHTSGYEMVQRLMGEQPESVKTPCPSQLNAAVQSATQYGMYSSMVAGMSGHALATQLARIGPNMRRIGMAMPIVFVAGAMGVGAVQGSRTCKNT